MSSRLARVSARVRTTVTGIPRSDNPLSHSSPAAPPRKPTHITSSPSACAAIATCAALPPGNGCAERARFTPPTALLSSRSRRSIAGLGLTQMSIQLASGRPQGRRVSILLPAFFLARVGGVEAGEHVLDVGRALDGNVD